MPESTSNEPTMLARYFSYFIRQKKARDYQINFVNISGKKEYLQWEKTFNVLSKICTKYKINSKEYIRFCVNERGIGFNNAKRLIETGNFKAYAENMKVMDQYRKIYDYFMKSANYIVDQCVEKGYDSCKEFLKRQILHNTLAEKMLSGKISIYYLATIKNIKEIVSKMDGISKDTFETLVERVDKLNSDVQDAFLMIKSQKVNPIKFTDELLYKRSFKRV